ncbi:MAG: Ig-like domain-containing protein [Phycisphaerae bacterium]|nr:Ig-like domain-containing protein [Phycisphaerae bacterium]
MTRVFRLQLARLVVMLSGLVVLLGASCRAPSQPGRVDDGSGSNDGLTTRTAQVDLPDELAGVGTMRALTGFGAGEVGQDGTCEIAAYGEGLQLVIVADGADHPLLMGWVGPEGGTISVRTTAEVLAFFGSGGFALTDDGRAEYIRQIAAEPAVDALADAIRTSLAESSDSLSRDNAPVRDALTDLLQGWGFAPQPKTEAARVLTDPSDEQSGVRINQVGVNRIYFRNRFRRAGYAFIDRDSWYGEDNLWHESPERLTEMAVPSVKGLNGAVGTFTDIINGDYAYAEVSTALTRLPVVPGSTITRYKVSVLGFGDTFGPLFTLPEYQQAKQREVALTWFVQDIFLPLVVNVVAPGLQMQSDEYERFFTANDAVVDYIGTMTGTIPAIKEAMDKGDLRGALDAAWGGLSTSSFFMKKTLDLVMDLIQVAGAGGAESGATALGMANKVLAAVGVVDQILYNFDVLQVIGALLNVRMAEVWTVDVSPPQVRLDPASSDIQPYDQVRLEAKVPEATGNVGQEDPVFVYHWRNTGLAGSLSGPSDDYDSSSEFVYYIADREPRGTDTITADVFELDGQERVPVGTASATVNVNGTKVTVQPATVTLEPDEQQTFTVSIDPVPQDGDVVYVWKNTGTAGHLAFEGGIDQFETTGGTPVYTANPNGRGSDFITVEAYKQADGQRDRLGSAQAVVRISPYVVSISPKQTVIPVRGTAELRANVSPVPPASAQLIYRWRNTGYLGDLRGGNTQDSSRGEALYITGKTGSGSDHVTVEVFEAADGQLVSLGLDDATVNVGSNRMKIEFIPEGVTTEPGIGVTCNAVVSDGQGQRMAGKTVRFTVSGVGELLSPPTVTTSENGWALAQVSSNDAGVAIVTATVPGEAARETCPVVIGPSVSISPTTARLETDNGAVTAVARAEPAIAGGILEYRWSAGGVGPSGWGIAGVDGTSDSPLAVFRGLQWPGQVGGNVGVDAIIDGHRVDLGGAAISLETYQDAKVLACQVGPHVVDGASQGIKAYFTWEGSTGDRWRILIYDDDYYYVLQPIPNVSVNTVVSSPAGGTTEYIVELASDTPENLAALQERAGKLKAHVSWIKPK